MKCISPTPWPILLNIKAIIGPILRRLEGSLRILRLRLVPKPISEPYLHKIMVFVVSFVYVFSTYSNNHNSSTFW